MTRFAEKLLLHFVERGCQGRILSVQRLCDLQEEIEGRYRQSLFDEEFYQERLAWFDFGIPDSLPEAKSLIVVAVPCSQSQAVFTWNGKSRELTLPPTYVGYEETRKMVEDLIAGIIGPKGYSITRTKLPLKLLAVKSGLGSYGRNNICYVPGMGSYLQLVAVFSDLLCDKDSWQDVQMMRRCQNCFACSLKCPTGAIPQDRFLLRAERCIVFHNEKPGNIPFPEWIDHSWHNCLVGCLHCQRICPENKDFMQRIDRREEFYEEETALLLQGVALDQLPAATVRKLRKLDLIEYLDGLPRNLDVFFRR